MSDEIDRLAELVVQRFDRVDSNIAAIDTRLAEGLRELKDALDAVGGHLAIKLDQLEERIVRVASDSQALADAFIPSEDNERRIRALERSREILERARDDLRGTVSDLENRLYVVQATAGKRNGSNGNGSGE
jgi:chromosome segregation ATPase